MTRLNLYTPETFDVETLRIEDNSIYEEAVTNPILEIKTPSAKNFIVYNNPFTCKSITLNCVNLKLCTAGCGGALACLPDGIYSIRYSVDPNLQTMVEFSHFRVTSLMKRYIQTCCKFTNKKCDYKKSEYKKILDKLIEIHFIILNAKWKSEECLENTEALALYEQAVTLLNDYDHGYC